MHEQMHFINLSKGKYTSNTSYRLDYMHISQATKLLFQSPFLKDSQPTNVDYFEPTVAEGGVVRKYEMSHLPFFTAVIRACFNYYSLLNSYSCYSYNEQRYGCFKLELTG